MDVRSLRRHGGCSPLGVAVWSIATLLTPPASVAFGMLIAMRVLLGLGEGVNFPAIHSITSRWTLAEERSRVITLNFSGMHLGTVTAFLVSPAIIVAFGWRALFYIAGPIGGCGWVCVWLWRTAETPETILASRAMNSRPSSRAGPPPRPRCASHGVPSCARKRSGPSPSRISAHNFGFYILLLWLPTYLDKTFAMALPRVGLFSLIPWISTFISSNLAGWIADRMMLGGFRVVTVRKTCRA